MTTWRDGQASFSTASSKRCQVPLPSLPEQQRIVAILDEAFAGLATATANAEKNLKNARELFESYLNSVFAERRDGWDANAWVKLRAIRKRSTD